MIADKTSGTGDENGGAAVAWGSKGSVIGAGIVKGFVLVLFLKIFDLLQSLSWYFVKCETSHLSTGKGFSFVFCV